MVTKVRSPLTEGVIRSLVAGEEVLISGSLYTARDMAHKRMCEALEAGEKLPFEPEGAIIYYCGPTPPRPGKVVGAAGPTTSGRMDAFSPKLYAAGVKATIGKGYRSKEVVESLKNNCAVHLSVIGGAGALLSKYIRKNRIIAYEELGIEAIRELEVEDFPAIVAYDSFGKSVYKKEYRTQNTEDRIEY
jgi:fumarate hydratase subunit beta